MKSESTPLDKWMKESLFREMLYRLIPWSVISIVIYLVISSEKDFSASSYYVSYMIRQINIFGVVLPVLIITTVIAVIFKDMDGQGVGVWKYPGYLGAIGVFIRKVLSDVLLWSYGLAYNLICLTLITAGVLIYKNGISEISGSASFIRLLALLVMLSISCGACYLFIRSDGKTIFSTIFKGSEHLIPPVYLIVALVVSGYFYVGWG
ncbi:hypothetical protein ACA373_06090 [Erwinia sp. STN24]|uniref:hypothetical protein n=1 Tax=Erwinia sp. STN24 TaxID=3233996 RepID=UPI003520658B